jgi:prevent-host-death family protein
MGAVSAAEANRRFSALLRRVQQGERMTITSRGRPVAELVPPGQNDAVRAAAFEPVLKAKRKLPMVWVGPFDRAELYERETE